MVAGRRGVQRVHPNVILAVVSLAALAYAVLSSAVIPALTTLQHSLHASETGVTWLLTGFLLSASVGTAIIGKLGDMYGKQRLLVWTLLILAAGTLLAALSSSLPVLIVARIVQGVAGGIFPLSFAIVRDEFPADRVPGSIGLMSAILGVGGGLGLVVGGLIDEHLNWHWLFWIPLPVMVAAALCTWRYIPESRVRSPGRVNWTAAALLTAGMSGVLIAIAQTSVWGWISPATLAVLASGLAVCGLWIRVELRSSNPLIDMTMMRVRGVWTANLAAFLLGAGLYACFLLLPQLAQLPRSTGFGYGASVVAGGLYLMPCALGMGVLGSVAGRVERRFTSRRALIAGAAVSAVACGWLTITSRHPYDMLLSSALLGVGIGLAFAALGYLIVQAVPAQQTGVASGMNTVLRTLGGALGGQIAATFVAANTVHGLPTLTGFTWTFAMSALFLTGCVIAGLLIPARPAAVTSLQAVTRARAARLRVLGLLAALAALGEHDLDGPLVGAAHDVELEGATPRRLQHLEQVIDRGDRAAGCRHDQVALGEASPRRRAVVGDLTDEEAVGLGQAHGAAEPLGHVPGGDDDAKLWRRRGLAAGERIGLAAQRLISGNGQVEALPQAVRIDPEQLARRVKDRAAGRARKQGCGVLEAAGDAAATRTAERAIDAGDESERHSQPAAARIGQREDRHADAGRRGGGPRQRRHVTGIDLDDGEVAVDVTPGHASVGRAPIGEGDLYLVAAYVVRVGQHAARSEHDT
jgi:EmrB/QacA subfamily drug resistance transporter